MAAKDSPRFRNDLLIYASIIALGCGVIAILLLADAVTMSGHSASRLVLCGVLLATAIAGYLLVKRGYKRTAATLLVVVVWSGTTVFAFVVGLGMHSSVVYLYIPALLYTSLLCGLRAAGAQTVLTIGALAAMHWAEATGHIAGVRQFGTITTNFNYALGIAVACLGSLVIAAAYQRTVHQAVRALNASRREIASAHDAVVAANLSLEKRVAERTAELQEKLDELEALNYSVAHDLRAPLRSINAFAGRLRDEAGENLNDEGRRMLIRVGSESLRMDRLLNALLKLGRLGDQPVEQQHVDLTAIARRVAEQLSMDSGNAKVRFLVESGLAARGDPVLLQTVLENLLGNAAKYSRASDRPEVEFGRASAGDEQVFFVNDNGVGFDQTHARQLFRPFFRLHPDAEYEGIGIGLASAQRILRRHQGRIWATGMAGRGATFYFSLPANAAAPA